MTCLKYQLTWGDSFIHVDEIDHIVYYKEPLLEALPSEKNQQVIERIGMIFCFLTLLHYIESSDERAGSNIHSRGNGTAVNQCVQGR